MAILTPWYTSMTALASVTSAFKCCIGLPTLYSINSVSTFLYFTSYDTFILPITKKTFTVKIYINSGKKELKVTHIKSIQFRSHYIDY